MLFISENKIFNPNNFTKVFVGWLLTLPFGSKILSFSIGFMTIYPNLIFTLIALLFTPFYFKKTSNYFKYLLIFQLIWVITAFIWGLTNGFDNYFIFDFRSLIMMLFFAIIISNARNILSNERLFSLIQFGIKNMLFILLLFGIIEFLFGFHFEGITTHKYQQLEFVNNFFYAPFFIYDNPNDYLTYLIFYIFLFILFCPNTLSNFYNRILLIVIGFVFSIYADSKFSKFIFFSLLFYEFTKVAVNKIRKINKRQVINLTISICFIFILIGTNKIYIGPIFRTPIETVNVDYKTKSQSSTTVSKNVKDNNTPTLTNIDSLNNIKSNNLLDQGVDTVASISAMQIRYNLIVNGWVLFTENPILGCGPGQYRKIHDEKKQYLETSTINSAHNFIIELLSQYGIIAILYLSTLIYLFVKLTRIYLKNKTEKLLYTLLFILFFPVFTSMPSAFLYFDINWLYLPLLFILLEKYIVKIDNL